MPVQDHYQVLGVAHDAPDEVIRAAYRALAAKYHPDRNPGDSAAELMLKRLNAAFAVLGDPEKRRQYDELTQGPSADSAPSKTSRSSPAKDPESSPRWKHPGESDSGSNEESRPGRATRDAADDPAPAPSPLAARRGDTNARILVAVFAVGASLYVNLTGPFAPENDASRAGMFVGLGLLALFVYWLAGRIHPGICAIGLAVVAVFVMQWHSSLPESKPTAGSVGGSPTSQPTEQPTQAAAPTADTAMVLYDRKTGEAADIPWDQATEALRSGKYGLPAGSRVPVVLANGMVGTVPIENAQVAFDRGARVATPAEMANAHSANAAASARARSRTGTPPSPTAAPSNGTADDCGCKQLGDPALIVSCLMDCRRQPSGTRL